MLSDRLMVFAQSLGLKIFTCYSYMHQYGAFITCEVLVFSKNEIN